jgi:uncharacterized protein (TIRG00374 family)
MKKKRTYLFSFIYMGVTIVAIIVILLFATDLNQIGQALKNFNIWWLFACIAALLLYWLMDALLLHDITQYMYKRVSLGHSIKVGLIGLYYCALTPSSTGGQPMQVVYMRRNNIPVGTATCIVCIKFVIYELSLCAIYITGMCLRGSYYYTHQNDAFWLAVLGFVINLVAVVFIILTIINKKLVLKMGCGLISLLSKIRIVKKKEQTIENFEHTIDDYHTAAAYISKYKLRALGSFMISVLNLSFLFVIPYLIYLSFGYSAYGIIDIFTMEAMLFLAVSFFPLPGAAGASEGGFLLFFGPFFGAATAVAMLIWRFLTYYMMLIVGSLLVVFDEVISLKRSKRSKPQS